MIELTGKGAICACSKQFFLKIKMDDRDDDDDDLKKMKGNEMGVEHEFVCLFLWMGSAKDKQKSIDFQLISIKSVWIWRKKVVHKGEMQLVREIVI